MANACQINKKLKRKLQANKAGKKSLFDRNIELPRRIKTKVISDFTRQLATLIAARVPIARALSILARHQKNKKLREILNQSLASVESGLSMSQSLSRHPKQFNALYINLLRVGETTGELEHVLGQLAQYLEKAGEMKRKVITAMTYPSVIILVAIFALNFIVFGVMPTFSEMFNDFGASQPMILRVFMDISHFMKKFAWIFILLGLIIVFVLRKIFNTPKGRWVKDGLMLRTPLFGLIIKKTTVARFTRTLGTLLSSGVSFVEALDVTERAMSNGRFKKEVSRIREFAERGESIERALQGSKLFPEMVVQMIAVGEETAELPSMLLKTAKFYEDEVDALIESLTSIIEPVIIVTLGVVLGGIIIGIYLQLFDLMNVIQ
ncbi:type II secretion system F family protein [bacterium]|nr:type II secretion system F family protein [bacterium]